MVGRIAGAACFSLLMATVPVRAEDRKLVDSRFAAVVKELRASVQACWNKPDMNKDDTSVVTVIIRLAKDGTIIGKPEIQSRSKDKAFGLLAESAVRAVTRCAPYSAVVKNPDFYEYLKVIYMSFYNPAH
ncbi:TonB C-terminal domain-containing protein [Phyllobacterium myrsinacearum]|uniref:Cell envelope integrity protein TolA n=1 Tax=Phyllobacterium myrsinacearum TaxID=28101 RepID=A0A2S9JII0_9HYPH|nr:TonB C-terminal domain-containing protein [Phyllobacterium myrsinacearum]PRD52898.1 hypothetical protein C5750_10735 [Phyllobacterium myrsinacearum]PWV94610.1 TonB-like protein [Phyllobacterium myrsinacearum]RZV07281.1 TonB-like protein [Phyllobacterium myrsinacearum]